MAVHSAGYFAVMLLFVIGAPLRAASVSFRSSDVSVPSEAVADGAPTGVIHRFYTTTDGDVLSINLVKIELVGGGLLYQHPFGDSDNAGPPNPGLVPLFPSLLADSWIDTPGTSHRLGPDLPGDGIFTLFGDFDRNGPQIDFFFAQLTLPKGTHGVFSGAISIDGGGVVYTQPFNFIMVPEPASAAFLAAGVIGIGLTRNRLR